MSQQQFPQRMMIIKLGAEQLVFDEDALTNKQIKQLRSDIDGEVGAYKSEMLKLEDEYVALTNKAKEDSQKREDESDEDHIERVKEISEKYNKDIEALGLPENDSYWLQDLAFRLLKILARQQGQEHKITPENFEAAPWKPMKKALATLFIEHEMEAGKLFLPPKLNEEN